MKVIVGFFWAGLVFIGLTGSQLDIADSGETDSEQPKLEVSWKPSFETNLVRVTIKNVGSKIIEINPHDLLIIKSSPYPDAATFDPFNRKPGIIYPVIEFLALPGDETNGVFYSGGIVYNGPLKLFIEQLKPDDTKDFSLNVNQMAILKSKNLNKANFILLLDGKRISIIHMAKIDGIWKSVASTKQ